jgi:hypothetical protein
MVILRDPSHLDGGRDSIAGSAGIAALRRPQHGGAACAQYGLPGRIVASGDNLGKLPIIDSRGFDEQGIHYIWRSFVSER